MAIGSVILGGLVGMVLGIVFRENITGDDYGAGQWQRASDKQFVSDPEGFVRWLMLPIATGIVGAAVTPVLYVSILSFVATASILSVLAAVLVVFGGLYLIFKNEVLA